MNFSLRVSSEDGEIIRSYAKLQDKSVSEVLRQAIIEKIESEIEIKMAEDAYKEYQNDSTTYTHEEMVKLLGID